MSTGTIKKIFIVDNDEAFANKLSNHLGKNKMLSISHYPTGEACLNKLDKLPDIIIMDYILDSQDKNAANGLDILIHIKKVDPLVHVIMLSSQTHYGIAGQTIAHGAEQYVMKDDDAFETIREIIDDVVSHSA